VEQKCIHLKAVITIVFTFSNNSQFTAPTSNL